MCGAQLPRGYRTVVVRVLRGSASCVEERIAEDEVEVGERSCGEVWESEIRDSRFETRVWMIGVRVEEMED